MRRFAIPLLVTAALLVPAPAAMADHHLMKVSELMLSSGGNPAAQLVELRDDFAEPFPASLEPYKLVVYDGAGAKVGAQELSAAPFRNTIEPYLLASEAAGLGAVRDAALTVALPAGSGQVCFTRQPIESRVHCVAYGCPASPLSGAEVGAAPGDGQSLQRADSGLSVGAPTPKVANVAGAPATCVAGGPRPPGGGPGGGGEAPADRAAPSQRLSGRLRQDVDRLAIGLRLDEAARVVVKATVRVPGRARVVRFRSVRRRVAADTRVSVRLRLGADALRSVRQALRRGVALTARVAVSARDAEGNQSSRARRIRLSS
jgi:hypothetical protein